MLIFDAESQQLEDVVCLVFLEHHFADFAERHAEEKVVDIVRKTWIKMSPAGHEAALALDLPAEARSLIETALEGALSISYKDIIWPRLAPRCGL